MQGYVYKPLLSCNAGTYCSTVAATRNFLRHSIRVNLQHADIDGTVQLQNLASKRHGQRFYAMFLLTFCTLPVALTEQRLGCNSFLKRMLVRIHRDQMYSQTGAWSTTAPLLDPHPPHRQLLAFQGLMHGLACTLFLSTFWSLLAQAILHKEAFHPSWLEKNNACLPQRQSEMLTLIQSSI